MRTLMTMTAGALTLGACTAATTSPTGDTGGTDDLFTVLTLTIDGATITEDVFVSGGWEEGDDQPPLITIVPTDGTSSRGTPGGYAFVNAALRFDADPKGVGALWESRRDVSGAQPVVSLVMNGKGTSRVGGGVDTAVCDVDMEYLETLPPNPLTTTEVHRYRTDVDCASLPWEQIPGTSTTGTWAVTMAFEGHIATVP